MTRTWDFVDDQISRTTEAQSTGDELSNMNRIMSIFAIFVSNTNSGSRRLFQWFQASSSAWLNQPQAGTSWDFNIQLQGDNVTDGISVWADNGNLCVNGTEHYYVNVIDGTDTVNQVKEYIDGTDSVPAEGNPAVSPNVMSDDSTGEITIGNNGAGNRPFGGDISEFAIFGQELTQAMVDALGRGACPWSMPNCICYNPLYSNADDSSYDPPFHGSRGGSPTYNRVGTTGASSHPPTEMMENFI